jgi:restriction system protein
MAAWVLKGGRAGEREQRMLDHGCASISWEEIPDLSGFDSRESLEEFYRSIYPGVPEGRIPNHVGQLFRFSHDAQTGHLIVVPFKTSATIAIGEVTGPYQYRSDLGPDMKHTLPVKWLRTDLPDLPPLFGPMIMRVRRLAAPPLP